MVLELVYSEVEYQLLGWIWRARELQVGPGTNAVIKNQVPLQIWDENILQNGPGLGELLGAAVAIMNDCTYTRVLYKSSSLFCVLEDYNS